MVYSRTAIVVPCMILLLIPVLVLPAIRVLATRTHSLVVVIDGDRDDVARCRAEALAAARGDGLLRRRAVTAAGCRGRHACDGHGHSSKDQGYAEPNRRKPRKQHSRRTSISSPGGAAQLQYWTRFLHFGRLILSSRGKRLLELSLPQMCSSRCASGVPATGVNVDVLAVRARSLDNNAN